MLLLSIGAVVGFNLAVILMALLHMAGTEAERVRR
jgi:hypothetical protein